MENLCSTSMRTFMRQSLPFTEYLVKSCRPQQTIVDNIVKTRKNKHFAKFFKNILHPDDKSRFNLNKVPLGALLFSRLVGTNRINFITDV